MHLVSGAVLDVWTALPDEVIVERILEGHLGLFEILMRRHNERLYRAARGVVRDEAEVEDIMQQAYVNAYANLRQFGGRSSFVTWLTRIAINEAIGRARRQGRYESLDNPDCTVGQGLFARRCGERQLLPAANNPERQAFSDEMKLILERAIDTLPDGQRDVFMLRDVEGLSTAETADSLGVNEDVVKTRLSRARAGLRRRLFDRFGVTATTSFTFHRPRCDRVVAGVLARIG